MGSVTHSITDFFSGDESIADRLRTIATPCLPAKGNKKVSIRIFDKKSLLGDATHSVEKVRQTLETFFNGLHQTAGLPAPVAESLHSFSFEVLFIPRDSTLAERRAFGMMDFPVYLDSTDGVAPLTEGGGKDLLLAHAIPERTQVRLIVSASETQMRGVDSYDEIKTLIKDEDQTTVGAGLPGTYFDPPSQTKCRKLGLIKMNLVNRNPVFDKREPKLIFVLKHELGHMFGMDHEVGTLMDPQYDAVVNRQDYTVNQLNVLNQSLTIIGRP